jgi:hypothetical protein
MTCGICEKSVSKSADGILDICQECFCKLHKVKGVREMKLACNECGTEIENLAIYSCADGEMYCEECFFEIMHFEDEQLRLAVA